MEALRKTGKYVAAVWMMIMLFAFSMTAYADEAAMGPVSLVVTDETGVDYDGTITVEFYDRNTVERVYVLELTKANSWGSGKTVNFELPVGLNCALIVRGDEGISLVNTWDRTKADDNFIIYAGPNEKCWSILMKKTEGAETVSMGSSPASESSGPSAATGSSKGEIQYPEAQALYEKFLSATEYIKTDAEANEHVSEYAGGGPWDKGEYYSKYMRDGSVEKYNTLSAYEAWVCFVTYTDVLNSYFSDMRNMYFQDEKHFKQYYIDLTAGEIKHFTKDKGNRQAAIDAYTKLMLWQYNYIKENGEPFNFINNCPYSEEMRQKRLLQEAETAAVPREEAKTKEVKQETKEVVPETKKQDIKETESEQQPDEKKEEKGAWGELMDSIASSFVTVLVVIVLGIALAVLWFRKKNGSRQ